MPASNSAQREQLAHLIADNYHFSGEITLHHVAHYWFEDRGIYRIEVGKNEAYLLRAFRRDVAHWLLGQAQLLTYLNQNNYRAPRLLLTRQGETIARHGIWMGLLMTYVEGEMADFSPETLEKLGEQIGLLHTLRILPDVQLPSSRLDPHLIEPYHIELLGSSLPKLPQELATIGSELLTTLEHIQQARCLPHGLLHGDCWPHNAVLTDGETLTMIDWDGAGAGPLLLDLGYLLMCCHLGKPQLPQMQADKELIQAVMRGYRRRRDLTELEFVYLLDAIRYDLARRAAVDDIFASITPQNPWQKNLWLQKTRARFEISTEIARLARTC
ncbi:phosphotransferase enzyme family protein [Ktedonospora formicarum]|uniref:Aminoglycoside phosphotransferase domain-containing protein n=1 Tax=Ktedonospora formicarum TaxID=2778364 RepID=A0A8J3I4E3_9CHLR|nr:phosphotransferase [Ktedonospora formicarum]GHO46778.1 hypothetical protein KSX_49410 [Ktedonospora formicarum]